MRISENEIEINVKLSIIAELWETIKCLRKGKEEYWNQIQVQMKKNKLPLPQGLIIFYNGKKYITKHQNIGGDLARERKADVMIVFVNEYGEMSSEIADKIIPEINKKISEGIISV
jgi:hypothetical protein